MFLINKSRFNEKDIQSIESHANSINICEFIIFIFNFQTGEGIIRINNSYQSGIVVNIIISAILMLISLYSFFYMLSALAIHTEIL